MEQKKETKEESPVATIIVFIILLPFFIWIGKMIYTEIVTDTSPVTTSNNTEIARCLSVPESIVRRLNDGLNINGGGSITNLQAVKSNDFESVYFISGILNGPGLGRDTDLVTFVTNKLDSSGTGLTLSAEAVAAEFSDWPDIATTNLGVSMGDDGYDESRKCVSNS